MTAFANPGPSIASHPPHHTHRTRLLSHSHPPSHIISSILARDAKMMLSASPFQYPYQSQNQTFYQPSRPSPLSERSANVLSRAPIFNSTMASQPQPQHEKKSVPVSVPVPQRQHKPNPVMQTRDQATQRRRDMFFRRVQKDREDRKWNARGEQVSLVYLERTRRAVLIQTSSNGSMS